MLVDFQKRKNACVLYSVECTHQMDNDPSPSFQFSERSHSNRTWEEKNKSESIKTGNKIIVFYLTSAIRTKCCYLLSFQLFQNFKFQSQLPSTHWQQNRNENIVNSCIFGYTRNNERTEYKKTSNNNNNIIWKIIFMCYNNIHFQCVDTVSFKEYRVKKKKFNKNKYFSRFSFGTNI